MDVLEGLADALEPPEAQFFDDPVGWVAEYVDFGGLTPYQEEVLAQLPVMGRVSMRSPHGCGKSALAALTVLWFSITRDGKDWKIITTASAWRQLTVYLWPEIRKWARCLRWEKLGRKPFNNRTELLGLSLRLSTGAATAVASTDHEKIEGAHADHLLYIFDEAKAIPVPTWDAAEGAFTGGGVETLALAISTPGEPQGRFYNVQKKEAGYEDWWVRHVTKAEAISAGRMDRAWADQRARQWGSQSAIYLNRVEGEFASSDEDGTIPLSWVEAAQDRWTEAHPNCFVSGGRDKPDSYGHNQNCGLPDFMGVGVDPARSGPDKTVLALRHGSMISEIRKHSKEGTTQTSSRVESLLNHRGGSAIVDVIGIGAGVVDQLRDVVHFRKKVHAFNSSEKTNRKDRTGELGFLNTRSAAWWHLRERLDPDSPDEPILLPPDDELTGDLTAPKWWVTGAGKIQIEGKDEIRKRLSRSPDTGDAVAMVFWLDAQKQRITVATPFSQGQQSYWKQAG